MDKRGGKAMKYLKLIRDIAAVVVMIVVVWCTWGWAQTLSKTDIDYYEITFYRLAESNTEGLVFAFGDTLNLKWVQPMSRQKFEEQPDPEIGSRTGESIKLKVPIEKVVWNTFIDTAEVSYTQSIYLKAGWWEVAVRVVDKNGKYSKESDPVQFAVVTTAPMVPVLLEIRIKNKLTTSQNVETK